MLKSYRFQATLELSASPFADQHFGRIGPLWLVLTKRGIELGGLKGLKSDLDGDSGRKTVVNSSKADKSSKNIKECAQEVGWFAETDWRVDMISSSN